MASTGRSIRKICRICGDDCSDRARVRDQFGHYYCRLCAEAAKRPGAPSPSDTDFHSDLSQSIDHNSLRSEVLAAIREEYGEEQPADDASDSHDEPPTELQPKADAAWEIDDDTIPLAPEDTAEDSKLKTCPVCFHKYPPTMQICANCGFDEKKGIQSSRFVEASRTPGKQHHHPHHTAYACPSCGYDMSACVSLKCPECGQLMPTRETFNRDELSRETTIEAYRTPAIYLAVGLAIMLVFGLINIGLPALVWVPAILAAEVIAAALVFTACCALWIGFDAPLHLNVLRLAGIFAISSGVSAIFGLLSIPILSWLIPLAFFISLFMQLMEVDFVDAAITLFLMMLVWTGINILAVMYLFS